MTHHFRLCAFASLSIGAAVIAVPTIAAAQTGTEPPPDPAASAAPPAASAPPAAPSSSPAATTPLATDPKPSSATTEADAQKGASVPPAPAPAATPEWDTKLKVSGYAEGYYSLNFRAPENGITNNRWIDEKHDSMTLQAAVLDLDGSVGPFSGKMTLMAGPTADRWYFEGARIPDSETATYLNPGRYSNETWKHLQQAYFGYKIPVGRGILVQGGLFLTQIGLEGPAVKDNWNWSRSNLFNFLPFFHVGARAGYEITDNVSVTAAIYNGYNSASDTNRDKSVSLQVAYKAKDYAATLLYFGGNERATGDTAGKPWRHLIDAVGTADVLPFLSVGVHGNLGFESSGIGSHSWQAAALYARAKALEWLFFAVRGDGIFETIPGDGATPAPGRSILLYGAKQVTSGTFTTEFRPVGDHFSFRLEFRHDQAERDSPGIFYYRGGTTTTTADDGTTTTSQNTSHYQNTFTAGIAGWF